ncbi:MAG: hypothetical protein INQ03_18130 [Candidatus Heimdallarchaeota archaeon]|nr:hypothetical protein [Candidatus Heimdallarchaeota archaeon]
MDPSNATIMLIQAAILFIIFLALLFQTINQRIYAQKYFMAVILLAFIRAILDMMLNKDRVIWSFSSNIHFYFYSATVIVWYFYGEIALNERPNLFRVCIVFLLLGLQIGMQYVGYLLYANDIRIIPTADYKNEYFNPEEWFLYPLNLEKVGHTPFWELPIDILQVFIFLFMLYVYGKMTVFSQGKKTFTASVLMVFSVIFFTLGALIELLEHFGRHEVNAGISMAPGFALLAVVYIYNPKFAYAAPVSLHRLIIIHKNGTMIANEIFDDKYTGIEESSSMISRVSSTLNQIFKEMTLSDSDLEIMKSSSSTILFAKDDNIMMILELEKSTYLLANALKDFSKEFVRVYHEALHKEQIKTEDFDNIMNLMIKYFPFIE